MSQKAGGRRLQFAPEGTFKKNYEAFAEETPDSADRLFGQLDDFSRDPDANGRFLRGAMDGRKRYLVPKTGGRGFLDEFVAVAEIEPSSDAVMLLRLHEVNGQIEADRIEQAEIARAEKAYDI